MFKLANIKCNEHDTHCSYSHLLQKHLQLDAEKVENFFFSENKNKSLRKKFKYILKQIKEGHAIIDEKRAELS